MTAASSAIPYRPVQPRPRRIVLGESWAPPAVRVVGGCAWLAACFVVFYLGIARDYGDALAHELIARRVVDSLTPGPAQLGTVWLPLPSLLLVPLVAIEPIWRAGLGGALLGFVYLQICVAGLYRVGWILGGSRAGWTAVIAFLANPNILYLFTAPLTEPPFLAFACLCAAGVADVLDGFARGEAKHGSMITASLGAAGALLSRYEGWMLALLAAAVLFLGSIVWLRQRHAPEAMVIGFSLIPSASVGLWLLYNLLIFDDPLAFLRGEHSSADIIRDLVASGAITAESITPARALLAYGQAAVEVLGPLAVAVAIAGALVALARVSKRPALAVLVVLAAPLLFSPIALALGQSVVITRAMDPNGLFNIRYGVSLALLFAVAAAALISPLRGRASIAGPILCTALVIGGIVLLADPLQPVVVAEGTLQRRAAETSYQAARWLRDQPEPGLILMDDSLEPQTMVMALEGGRLLNRFVGSFAPSYWIEALRQPNHDITWIGIISERSRSRADDRVRTALLRGDRITGYSRVFDNGEVAIFKREAP